MRRITSLAVLAGLLLITGCSMDEDANRLPEDVNFRVSESTVDNLSGRSAPTFCFSTPLIAGQNTEAGVVEVSVESDDLVIVYKTGPGWFVKKTHLSIGDCDLQSFPLNGGGNPKIGQFEYQATHSLGIKTVTYRLNKLVLEDNYCFAAHAEVKTSNQEETAWAQGVEFPGNSWAMFVEGVLSDCDTIVVPPPA